ncbi:MAG: hypothetical protein P1U34_08965 [Coxiellaceae bacterium]|nr:hypothetical protein [Coxiellaceae bacterium]
MRNCAQSIYRAGVRVSEVGVVVVAGVSGGVCGAVVGVVAGSIVGGAANEPGYGAVGGAVIGFLAGAVMGASFGSRAMRREIDSDARVVDTPQEPLILAEESEASMHGGFFCC